VRKAVGLQMQAARLPKVIGVGFEQTRRFLEIAEGDDDASDCEHDGDWSSQRGIC
jgi:hypothetical protein